MSESISNLLKQAMHYKDMEDYKKSQECLDLIIKDAPENHLTWYEKSKLPILQDDSVIYKNRNISLSAYNQLSLPDKHNYLQQCGFEIAEIPEVETYLKVPTLLEKQRVKYLKMAIRYAPDSEKIIYMSELEAIGISVARKNTSDKKIVTTLGVIASLAALFTSVTFGLFPSTHYFKSLFNVIIVPVVPYILSVTGMAVYTKAKNIENTMIVGFICNLIALVISNLSIIWGLVIFFQK